MTKQLYLIVLFFSISFSSWSGELFSKYRIYDDFGIHLNEKNKSEKTTFEPELSNNNTAAALAINCPPNKTLEGCNTDEITALATGFDFSTTIQSITEAQFTNAGGTITSDFAVTSITYIDVVISTQCPVEVERTFTVHDSQPNTVTCIQKIYVRDNFTPQISLPENAIFDCYDSNTVNDWASIAYAIDNCDPNPTITYSYTPPSGLVCNETVEVTFTAEDECGKKATTYAYFTIFDNVDPSFNEALPANTILECDDAIPPPPTLTASDNCDPNPSVSYNQTRTDGINNNNYILTRTWIAEDNCGNTRTHTQTITIQDTTDPVITSSHSNKSINANANCQANLPDYTGDVTATDNCDNNLTITQNPAAGTIISGINNTVTLTATDGSGNTDEVTFNVQVIDNTDPTITSTHNNKSIYANANCQANLPDYTGDVTATDNCDNNLTITQTPVAGTIISGINNTVTLTVADDAGNIDEVSFNVAVVDNTDPTITSTHNDKSIYANANCQTNLPDYTGDVTATDNCDNNLTITQNPAAGTIISGINNTVTLTVTDDAGNIDEVSFNVAVVDNTDPVITSTHNNKSINANANCQATLPNYTGDVTATDNCDNNLTITQNPAVGTIISGINNTVILTVTDDAGNTDQVTFNVQVIDNTNPTITSTHNDESINANANCQASLPDYTGDVTATDNCDNNLTITQNPAAGTTISGINNTVTLTVTDDAGNIDEVSFNVAVVDNTDPTITSTHNDKSIYANANCQANLPDYTGDVTATDNCDNNLTITQNPAAGTIISGINNTVTLTATDDSGNTDEVTFNVQIVDNTDPVITSTHNDKSINANVNCQASLPDYASEIIATDNCDNNLTITQNPIAGTTISGISNTVTLTVSDDAGNFDEVSFNVAVVDNSAPVITSIHNDKSIDAESNCEASLPDYIGSVIATDNCDNNLDITQNPAAGTIISGSTNTITLTVTDDAGNTDQVTFNVQVVDNTDPTITSTHNDESINANAGCDANLPDYTGDVTATDNCDNNLTITQTPAAGTIISGINNTVTLTATDDSGNTDEITFNVAVVDNTDPTITSTHNDESINANAGCDANLPDYTGDVTATDNCDNNLTITQNPIAGTIISGSTNTVTLTVTDDTGNTDIVSFNVEVVENTDPTITSTHNDKSIYANANCQANLPDYTGDVTATDNCDNNLDITQNPAAGTVISGSTNTVTLTVTDDSGNTDQVTFNVQVIDNTDPTITSAHNDESIYANANCQANLPDYTGDVTATDNCDNNLDITQNPAAGTIISGINNTVTLTVTDDAENTDEITFNVAVVDNTDPTITSTHNDESINANAGCDANLPDYTGDVTATDNCDNNLDITQNPAAGTIISGSTNTITLTVTDDAGNTDEVTFNVEVVENTDPTITSTHNDKSIYANAGCDANLPDYTGDVTATDNCDNNLDITQNPAAGTIISGINNTVTLTVTDDSGNTDEVTFNVQVIDNTDPTITSTHNDESINANAGCDANLPDYTGDVTATDNCDNNLDITQNPAAGTIISGINNTVTLTATDDSGNTDEVTFNVQVVEDTAPTITSTHNDKSIYANAGCDANLPDYTGDVSATDNCDNNLDITQTPAAGTIISGSTNTVTLTVTDDSGNTDEVTFNVQVIDNTDPTITSTHNDESINANSGCDANLPDYTGDVTATDNCDNNLDITQNPAAGTIISGINNTVTLTATDDSGNTDEVTFNVQVVEDTAPTITSTHNDKSIYANAGCDANLPDYTGDVTATDNCDNNLDITQTPAAGTIISGSTNTVTLTVTDDSGNTDEVTFNVQVIDNTDPTITSTHNDESINANSGCDANLPDYTGDVTATDNCDNNLDITQTPAAGTIISGINNTITLTVTDDAGNTDEVTFNVEVTDNTNPIITSTHNNQNIDSGTNCQVPLPDYTGDVTATDNCDNNLTITQNPAIGTTISGANNTVTLTVTDDAGNIGEVTFNVAVIDNVNPTLFLPPTNLTLSHIDNTAIATWAHTASATDNCDGSVNVTHSYGTTVTNNTLTVRFRATDSSGNTTTRYKDITINDNSDPVITLPATNLEMECFNASEINLWAKTATATDNGASIPVYYSYNSPTSNCNQNIVVTFTSRDGNGNTATATKTVIVDDRSQPVITLPTTNLSLSCYEPSAIEAWANTASATDNCEGTVPVSYSIGAPTRSGSVEIIPVTFTATDECGNVASREKSFSVSDITTPSISCATPEDEYYLGETESVFTVSGSILDPINTSDNCPITVTNDYNFTGTLDGEQFSVGTTLVRWYVSDGIHERNCSYTVNVIDMIPPCIGCNNGISCSDIGNQVIQIEADESNYTNTGTLWDVTATDNVGVKSLEYELTGATTGTGTSLDGVTFEIGETTVTWTATDESDNQESCSFTVTIVNTTVDLAVRKEVDNRYVENGDQVTFTITVSNNSDDDAEDVTLTDILPSGYTYVSSITTIGSYNEETGIWLIGDLSANSDQTLYVTATVNLNGNYLNTAEVTGTNYDADLSNNISSDEIADFCELSIPEIFTPNGDGIQDNLQITCIERYPNATFTVFNRNGTTVYQKEHYGNSNIWGDDAWWDGSSNSKWTVGGEKLPAATYFYILDLKDGSEPRTGYIYLNN